MEWGVPNMSMVTPVPALTVVPDYLDAPYGHIHEPTTDKPSHLALHPGMVQHREVLLASTSINAQDTLDGFVLNTSTRAPFGDQWESVSTNVILPVEAGQIFVSSENNLTRRVNLQGGPFVEILSVGDTIGLSVGRAAAALRIITLDGTTNNPTPTLALKGDSDGLALGAVRLVGYHSRGRYQPAMSDVNLRFAFVLKAGSVGPSGPEEAVQKLLTDVKCARVTSISSNGVWKLQVSGIPVDGEGPVSLTVERNLSCAFGGSRNQTSHTSWNCLTSRQINASELSFPTNLRVNGAAVAPLPKPDLLTLF